MIGSSPLPVLLPGHAVVSVLVHGCEVVARLSLSAAGVVLGLPVGNHVCGSQEAVVIVVHHLEQIPSFLHGQLLKLLVGSESAWELLNAGLQLALDSGGLHTRQAEEEQVDAVHLIASGRAVLK